MLSNFRTFSGNLFHYLGAKTLKLQSGNVFLAFVCGTCRIPLSSADLKEYLANLGNVTKPAFRLHCKKCMGEIPSVTLTLITQIPMYYVFTIINMIKAANKL